jgi:hypothetical protein
MDKSVIAVTLRWLAILWVLGYALYVALGDGTRLSTVEGTLACLATLLIPASFAFGLSCVLGRYSALSRPNRKAPPAIAESATSRK